MYQCEFSLKRNQQWTNNFWNVHGNRLPSLLLFQNVMNLHFEELQSNECQIYSIDPMTICMTKFLLHHSHVATHYSYITTHCSLLTAHCSQLDIHILANPMGHQITTWLSKSHGISNQPCAMKRCSLVIGKFIIWEICQVFPQHKVHTKNLHINRREKKSSYTLFQFNPVNLKFVEMQISSKSPNYVLIS